MTLTRKKARTWLCPKCSHRNEVRTSSRKCQGCGEQTKPKPRSSKAKPRDSYAITEALSVAIHGGFPGACAVCGKPKPDTHRHDRDHDHGTGLTRGVACYRCNHHLLRFHTADTLRACLAYLERVEAWYGRA